MSVVIGWNGTEWEALRSPEPELINGHDRGDLLADIDRALGDIFERTMQRYVGPTRARELRRAIVEELGNEVGEDASR